MGLFKLDPNTTIFGIGSICMRKPPELYDVVEYIRGRVPSEYRIHCFGIAQPSWVRQLANRGVTSCDSASAGWATKFCEFIDCDGKRHKINTNNRNKYMASATLIYNIFTIEEAINSQELFLFDDLLGEATAL